MRLDVFEMERMQSLHEHEVELNLSESGVEPLRLSELLELAPAGALDALLAQPLCYTQTNGTEELRQRVAALHPGATPSHVEVTNGSAEANLLVLLHLVDPGDEVVLMLPNYMQAWGLARGLGGVVREWWLRETDTPAGPRWRPDVAALEELVTPRTKLIAICAPNNPTGARLDAEDFDAIGSVAARHGAWLLSDEVYRGAELDGIESPSAWGRYERVIVTGGLSKAYGLPGLRLGWVVGPPDTVASLWAVHDYTTIAPSALSDQLARVALDPEVRRRLLDRTRRLLAAHYPIVERFVARHHEALELVPPEAGAIALVRYRYKISSTELMARMRAEHSTLVVPGDQFHMGRYLRLGFGSHAEALSRGLDRLSAFFSSLEDTR